MSGNTDGLSEAITGFMCGVLGLLAGAMIAGSWVDVSWCKSCIKHGAAEYNQTTGAWQWKEPGTE